MINSQVVVVGAGGKDGREGNIRGPGHDKKRKGNQTRDRRSERMGDRHDNTKKKEEKKIKTENRNTKERRFIAMLPG